MHSRLVLALLRAWIKYMRFVFAVPLGLLGFALSYVGGWIERFGGMVEDAADWLAE